MPPSCRTICAQRGTCRTKVVVSLSHTFGNISVLIKAREVDHNKSLCKQWQGNREACGLCTVAAFGVGHRKIIIICLTNQGKGAQHLLTATTDAQLNTQHTIFVINTSLLSESGSANTHIYCVRQLNNSQLTGSF